MTDMDDKEQKILKKRLWDKNLYNKRKEQNLCVHCGSPLTDTENTYCTTCRAKSRSLYQRRREAHLCAICGSPLVETEKAYCASCKERRRQNKKKKPRYCPLCGNLITTYKAKLCDECKDAARKQAEREKQLTLELKKKKAEEKKKEISEKQKERELAEKRRLEQKKRKAIFDEKNKVLSWGFEEYEKEQKVKERTEALRKMAQTRERERLKTSEIETAAQRYFSRTRRYAEIVKTAERKAE